MVLPNETLLDVFACVDYPTVVSLIYSPFSCLIRANWDTVARRRYYIIEASGIRADDLLLEVREWIEKDDTCVIALEIECRNCDWQALAEAIRIHPVVHFTLSQALSLANFSTLATLLPRLVYAERLTIERYRRFRRRDISRLLDSFITPFKTLRELQLLCGGSGYFSASCLHCLNDERILRIPTLIIRLHPSYRVDKEKEDIVYRFCFDFSRLPSTERKLVDIRAYFSDDFCRRVVQGVEKSDRAVEISFKCEIASTIITNANVHYYENGAVRYVSRTNHIVLEYERPHVTVTNDCKVACTVAKRRP